MSSRFCRRIAQIVVAIAMSVVVATSPASALRLAPVDTPSTSTTQEVSVDDSDLLLTGGLLTIHMADRADGPAPDPVDEMASLIMTKGRLSS